MLELQKYIEDIKRLCRKHKVHRLYAFGSALTDRFTEESDIDLMVDFEPIDVLQYADNYFDLKFSLENMFNRRVDLLEEKAVRNPYFMQAVSDKRQLVYEH